MVAEPVGFEPSIVEIAPHFRLLDIRPIANLALSGFLKDKIELPDYEAAAA